MFYMAIWQKWYESPLDTAESRWLPLNVRDKGQRGKFENSPEVKIMRVLNELHVIGDEKEESEGVILVSSLGASKWDREHRRRGGLTGESKIYSVCTLSLCSLWNIKVGLLFSYSKLANTVRDVL